MSQTLETKPQLVQISSAWSTREGAPLGKNRYVELEIKKTKTNGTGSKVAAYQKPCQKMTEGVVMDGGRRGELVKVCADPSCRVHHPDTPSPEQVAKERAEERKRIEKSKQEITIRHCVLAKVLERVLVQPEMERGRSPLVSIPPFGRGFSRHRYDHQAIPQHGCVPAEPASVSPGKIIVAPPRPSVSTVAGPGNSSRSAGQLALQSRNANQSREVMRDLISRFLNNGFSRRDFAKQLMALGFTASAAASILEPLEAMETSRAVAGAAAGGEKVISGTGGELLVAQAREAGVEYLFTNPGSYEVGFFDAVVDDSQIQLIEALHEGLVISMADGYHKVSKKPAFVNVHSIAGTAQMAGQLYNASRDGSAIVVTAGLNDNEVWSDEIRLGPRPGFDQKEVNLHN